MKEVEQPNYEAQLTGLSDQVSDVQEIADSLKDSNVAERMAELDRRKAELNDLESKLEEKSKKIEAAAKEVSIKRIPGKAYWAAMGAGILGALVWAEYTGFMDWIDLTRFRG